MLHPSRATWHGVRVAAHPMDRGVPTERSSCPCSPWLFLAAGLAVSSPAQWVNPLNCRETSFLPSSVFSARRACRTALSAVGASEPAQSVGVVVTWGASGKGDLFGRGKHWLGFLLKAYPDGTERSEWFSTGVAAWTGTLKSRLCLEVVGARGSRGGAGQILCMAARLSSALVGSCSLRNVLNVRWWLSYEVMGIYFSGSRQGGPRCQPVPVECLCLTVLDCWSSCLGVVKRIEVVTGEWLRRWFVSEKCSSNFCYKRCNVVHLWNVNRLL